MACSFLRGEEHPGAGSLPWPQERRRGREPPGKALLFRPAGPIFDTAVWTGNRPSGDLTGVITTRLILASGSPRRRELLTEMGLKFEVVAVPVTELDRRSAPSLSPAKLTETNAHLKAQAAWRPGWWVLGADTVVTLKGVIFGKPGSLEEARETLHALSGCTHEVTTGVALIDPGGLAEVFHETSRVTFRVLTDAIITRYLAHVSVLDKAGAYALQERGDWLIERVEGSLTNVIGLPVERLKPLLSGRGVF
jgi:septum formation protein